MFHGNSLIFSNVFVQVRKSNFVLDCKWCKISPVQINIPNIYPTQQGRIFGILRLSMRQNYTLGTTFSVCSAGNNLALIIILFVENVLSQCRRCSVVLFSEMKIYQIYVIRDERKTQEIWVTDCCLVWQRVCQWLHRRRRRRSITLLQCGGVRV